MNEVGLSLLARTVIGFILAPILPSVFYTWGFWGDAFYPMIYIVLPCAYFLAFVFLAPVHFVMFSRGAYSLYVSGSVSFAILFLIFAVFFLVSGAGYNLLISGEEILVKDGAMTLAGYKRGIYGAFLIALHSLIGCIVFSAFVRGRKLFSSNYLAC